MYHQLTGKYPPLMGKFIAWFYVNHPDFIAPNFKHIVDQALKLGADPEDRSFFFNIKVP